MRSAPDSTRLDEQEQVFMVPGPRDGTSLFLRRLGPSVFNAYGRDDELKINVLDRTVPEQA